MPSKRKNTKSQQKPKNATAKKKSTAGKKKAARNKRPVKVRAAKKAAKKKSVQKKTAPKSKASRKRRASVSTERELRQEIQNRNLTSSDIDSELQSGDLEGLSRDEQADSESVEELVGEGNTFEGEAVAGVEQADDSDEREVHTHEVPEDDVPEEYLEKD
jgi:hypothetical protein